MTQYLDVANWVRRDLFEFFKDYSNPYFNVCTNLDVTRLVAFVREQPGLKISLVLHYYALRIANEVEPFRYRLQDGQVLVYDRIHGGTTVLLPNESFSYAYFDYHDDFEEFVTGVTKSIKKVQAEGSLKPTMRDDLIYFTVLPWMSFTSFAHARTPGRGQSVPRIAFGKFTHENERTMLPISVEVHHALMDGLHVGRYLNRLEEALSQPETFVQQKGPLFFREDN